MKKYIFFCAIAFVTHHSRGMDTCREIAINMHGRIRIGTNRLNATCLFVPVTFHRNGHLIAGGFIPLVAIEKAKDGDKIAHANDESGNLDLYTCNQSNASENQPFQEALQKITSKKVE